MENTKKLRTHSSPAGLALLFLVKILPEQAGRGNLTVLAGTLQGGNSCWQLEGNWKSAEEDVSISNQVE